MKIKRYKQARHILNFYKRNFGLREPYQIIIDGTFCQAALKGKIQLKEQLSKYLGGEVKLVTTSCVIAELVLLGKELGGAVFIAKRFQLRSCGHGKKAVPATDCVQSLIGDDNSHHYLVASQDPDLRRPLRRMAGVPIFHIIRNTIVLEKPTETSKEKVEELVASRVEPSEYQKSVLEQLDVAAGTEEKTRIRGLKRRAKAPNPLSVKKSTKIREIGRSASSRSGISRNKKRRQRMQIRRALESISSQSLKQKLTDVN